MRGFIPLFALGLVACGGGSGGWSVTDQPLAGTIEGAPWTFVAGDTSSFLSDEDGFFANLYAASFEACGFDTPDEPFLLVRIPTEPGVYDFGFGAGRSMTFVTAPGENLITFDGGIVVDAVTDTTVTGGLYGRYDSDNEVDGNFSVTLCADD